VDPLKVFISVDLEGVSGVVHRDHTSTTGCDYQRARKLMTQEANAAIAGALEAGATEVVVNDSHGEMRNLLIEELNPKAYLITGSPKALGMMEGIDESFSAVVFIGYHARKGTQGGVLDHTISGGRVANIWINGTLMSEASLNAAIAGYYGVPVVAISGDDKVVRQTKELIGEQVEGIVVKQGLNRYAAKCVPPKRALEMIREGVKKGIERRGQIPPYRIDPPIRMELEFPDTGMADRAILIPKVRRLEARKVTYEGSDFLEVFNLIRALILLAG